MGKPSRALFPALLLCLLAGTLTLAAPRRSLPRKQTVAAPAPGSTVAEPWNIPPDLVAPTNISVERLEVEGLILYARTEPQATAMELAVQVRAPNHLPGATTLLLAMAHGLRYGGVKDLEGAAFTRLLAEAGLHLELETTPDLLRLALDIPLDLSSGTDGGAARAVELLARLVRSPAYPDSDATLTRRAQQELGRARAADPLTAALDQLRALLFASHPFAAELEPAVYAELSHARLLETHQQTFGRNRAVVTVSSPFPSGTVQEMVRQAFVGWEAVKVEEPPPPPPPLTGPQQARVAQPGSRMAAVAGSIIKPSSIDELLVVDVLAHLLDASLRRYQSSEPGLRAGARLEPLGTGGMLWAFAEGRSSTTTEVLIRRELARIGRGEVGAREIAWARATTLSDAIAGMSSVRQLLEAHATYELLRGPLPADFRLATLLDMLRGMPLERVTQLGQQLLGQGQVAVVTTDSSLALEVQPSPAQSAGEAGH